MIDEIDLASVNPLKEDHLQQINKALSLLDLGIKRIELAKRAGIDFPEREKQLLEMKRKFEQIKQVYFPGR